ERETRLPRRRPEVEGGGRLATGECARDRVRGPVRDERGRDCDPEHYGICVPHGRGDVIGRGRGFTRLLTVRLSTPPHHPEVPGHAPGKSARAQWSPPNEV